MCKSETNPSLKMSAGFMYDKVKPGRYCYKHTNQNGIPELTSRIRVSLIKILKHTILKQRDKLTRVVGPLVTEIKSFVRAQRAVKFRVSEGIQKPEKETELSTFSCYSVCMKYFFWQDFPYSLNSVNTAKYNLFLIIMTVFKLL